MNTLIRTVVNIVFITSLNAQHFSKVMKIGLLFNAIGLKEEINKMPAMVLEDIEKKNEIFNKRQFSIFKKILLKTFNELEMYKIVNNQFIMNYDDCSVDMLINWYMSDFGKRIVRIESEDGADPSQLTSFQRKLRSNHPDKRRIELISQINDIINNQKVWLNILITLEHGKYVGISPYLPHKKHFSIEEIKKKLIKSSPNQELQKLALNSSLYRYKTLSNNELKKYVTFLRTMEFSWYFKNMIMASEKLMFQFGKIYGNEIGKIIYQKKN